jgi:hypothetical protein
MDDPIVEVCEFEGRRWEARRLLPAESGDRKTVEQALFDTPQAALDWARARAEVVVVERPLADGRVTSFSAGSAAPPWNGSLPRLDEPATLARAAAPTPVTTEELGWLLVESDDGSG